MTVALVLPALATRWRVEERKERDWRREKEKGKGKMRGGWREMGVMGERGVEMERVREVRNTRQKGKRNERDISRLADTCTGRKSGKSRVRTRGHDSGTSSP